MLERLSSRRARGGRGASSTAVDSATRRTTIALAMCTLLVLMLLAWSTWDHIDARLEREYALAAHVTDAAAYELSRGLSALDMRLRTFVSQEQSLLSAIAENPDAAVLVAQLWSLIQLVFPTAQGGLLLDERGLHSLTLGQWPGEEAEQHVRRFFGGHADAVQIGGGEPVGVYVAALCREDDEPAAALLIHVAWSALTARLDTLAPDGHRLHAMPEGTAANPGARSAEGGDGAANERSETILAQHALGGTGWLLQDRLDNAYAASLISNRIALAAGLAAVYLMTVVALYRWVLSQNRSALRGRLDLRETHLKLQAILSATTDGIVLTDRQGRIELLNPAAEMMFGRLAEDVLGMSVERMIPELLSSDSGEALLGTLASEHSPPLVRETLGKRRDGREFPIRVWLSGVRFNGPPHLLTTVQDLSEQERNEKQLLFLEQRDVVTGLYNRRELEHRLSELMSDTSDGGPHVLCYLDVDQFKVINDTCGHTAGDELLKQLAILLEARFDEAIIIARLGGDEFAALLAHHKIDEARAICDGFMQTVRNFLFTWRDQSFDVAVSMGLVEFGPGNESPASVLSKADVACHMAKTLGRDRIHAYHEGDAELTRHHGDMRLVSAISRALSEGRFHIYAQPIEPLASPDREPRHFEVLVRMVDESGGPVIPDHFIPAAERYILMPAVDRWIINRLFSLQAQNLRAWHRVMPTSFLFAINLSSTSLADEAFLRYLKRQFSDWNIPYSSICFEITETAAIHNLAQARAFMDELRALGCSFALDDFGSGFSSYGYLRELPVEFLKIDGSFVRGMTEDPVNQELVASINQIGHVLGLKTIAEWAEDQLTIDRLRALKVDFAQGFGIGEPIPVCNLTLAAANIPHLADHRTHGRCDAAG